MQRVTSPTEIGWKRVLPSPAIGMTGLMRIIRVSSVKNPSPGPKMRPGRSAV